MIRVALVGGAGRMGQVLARGLGATPECTVVALVDPTSPPDLFGAQWCRTVDELDPASLDVLVDFSTPDTTRHVVAWALQHDRAVVIGTTGLNSDDHETFARGATEAHGHILLAPNFSLGAVLSQRFAVLAARYFDGVEIIELHHDAKVDAPSGTSLAAASAIAGARADAGLSPLVDRTERFTVGHSRGADAGEGVRIHSVRLRGLIAHQEIIFGSPGEGLTIRHDSYDRQSYVAGVALAVRAVGDRPGWTFGLDELI